MLTPAERQQARDYLGYPTISGAWNLARQGESLDARIAELPTEAEEAFKALLGKIAASREGIEAARGRLKAVDVSGIKLNPRELPMLWQEDLHLCRQLARIVALPVEHHPAIGFSGSLEVL
jgi:hypothetical protein